jgi:hypothetical protein
MQMIHSPNKQYRQEFHEFVRQLRADGHHLPDDAKVDEMYEDAARQPDQVAAMAKLRKELQSYPRSVAGHSTTVQKFRKELSEATGRDYSSDDVSLGDFFGRVFSGKGQ